MDKFLAIIWLRFRLIRHQMRSASGVVNLIVGGLLFIAGTVVSLGLAVGFSILVYVAVRSADPLYMRLSYYIVFYAFFFFGVIFPIIFMSGTTAFEPSRFLIFPVSRRTLYGVMLASSSGSPEHLFYYPSLLAIFITGVLISGVNLFFGSAIFLLLFIFYIVASNALILFFQSIMKQRRIKEIIAIISFMILIALSLVPSMIQTETTQFKGDEIHHLKTVLHIAMVAGKAFPPSIAAEGLVALHAGKTAAALLEILWLLLWIHGVIALGYYVFIHHHLEKKGRSRKRKKEERTMRRPAKDVTGVSLDTVTIPFLSEEVMAVVCKDLRYLFRSVVGKFNLLMIPVFIIVIVFIFAKGVSKPFMGIDPRNLIFFGMLLCVTIFSNNFWFNSFAWEKGGVKSYFISPVPLHRIILGKNLAVWVYNAILFAMSMLMWMILVEIPDPLTFMTGILLFNISILTFAIGGNFISIMSPASRDISSMRNNASQTAILLSLVSLIFNVIIIFVFLALPLYLEMRFLQPVFLAILLALQIAIYSLTLKYAARLLEARKENLIQSLREKV